MSAGTLDLDTVAMEMQRNHDRICRSRPSRLPLHWRNCSEEHCSVIAAALPEEWVPLMWADGRPGSIISGTASR